MAEIDWNVIFDPGADSDVLVELNRLFGNPKTVVWDEARAFAVWHVPGHGHVIGKVATGKENGIEVVLNFVPE